MRTPPDAHTRRVKAAKVVLPVIAFGLFASLFIYSRTNETREGLIFADSEMRALAESAQITNPQFSGVTTAGDAFSVSATVAMPDAPKPGRIDLENPNTTVNFASGVDLSSSANAGSLDIRQNLARLDGDVSLETSNGYRATAESLQLDFRTGNVDSPGQVTASGPIGSIEAGAMELKQDLDDNPRGGASVLIFKNGVKVIYTPPASQE